MHEDTVIRQVAYGADCGLQYIVVITDGAGAGAIEKALNEAWQRGYKFHSVDGGLYVFEKRNPLGIKLNTSGLASSAGVGYAAKTAFEHELAAQDAEAKRVHEPRPSDVWSDGEQYHTVLMPDGSRRPVTKREHREAWRQATPAPPEKGGGG